MKTLNISAPGALPTFLALFLLGHCVEAGVFIVTDTNDTTRVTSLRGAIMAANQIGHHSMIYLGGRPGRSPDQTDQWTYKLTCCDGDEIDPVRGSLEITQGDLTIVGMSSNVVVDASALLAGVFRVYPGAHLTLSGLTITGGTAPLPSGGAIFNAGSVALRGCVLSENWGVYGGAIYNEGVLRADSCTFFANACGQRWPEASGGNGGAIYNSGACFLNQCVISGNSAGEAGADLGGAGATGGNGGGIYNSGTTVLNSCTINGNLGGAGGPGDYGWCGGFCIITVGAPVGPGGNGGSGGGIFNAGTMALDFCTVNDNYAGKGGDGDGCGLQAHAGGSGGGGGGIFNTGGLRLNTCTISGNHSGAGGNGTDAFDCVMTGGKGGAGGGICHSGATVSLDVLSCTIAFNEAGPGGSGGNRYGYVLDTSDLPSTDGGAGGFGGGVLNGSSNANIIVRNTLIALNTAGVGGSGGTAYLRSGPPQWTMTNIVGNAGSLGAAPDLAGDFISQGFNLIAVTDGSRGFARGVLADQAGSSTTPIDPHLGPLQMNGGSTPTHKLLPGSSAIDQGNGFGIRTDQRGNHRPYDYPSLPNASDGDGNDIGAFELQTR